MIKIGVIGCGNWGPNLIRDFNEFPDCEVTLVCDLKKDRLNFIKSRYPSIATTQDHHELLNNSQLDAIVISTPVSSHYQLTKEVLLAGKNVLVEKPLALNSNECMELIKIKQSQKKVLMVGHTFIYNAAVEKLKEYIKNGELGEVLYIYSRRLNLGTVRDDHSSMWSLAPHDISIIRYLIDKEPLRVRAKGYAYLNPDLEDVVFLTMDFSDGIGAHIHISWLDPSKIREMTVVGSNKMAVYDDTDINAKIKIYDKGVAKINKSYLESHSHETDSFGDFQLQIRSGDILMPKIDFIEPLKVECRHFLDCIKKKQEPITNAQEGLKVVKILEAAQKSLEKDGVTIEVK